MSAPEDVERHYQSYLAFQGPEEVHVQVMAYEMRLNFRDRRGGEQEVLQDFCTEDVGVSMAPTPLVKKSERTSQAFAPPCRRCCSTAGATSV